MTLLNGQHKIKQLSKYLYLNIDIGANIIKLSDTVDNELYSNIQLNVIPDSPVTISIFLDSIFSLGISNK